MKREFEVAAKWWADKLRSDKLPGRDYVSDPNQVSGIEWVAAQMTAKRPDFKAEDVDRFQNALAHILYMDGRRSDGSEYFYVSVGTDYHPDRLIDAAAKIAGLPDLSMYLPWKTMMFMKPGRVVVREGYGAPAVHLMGYQESLKEWEAELELWRQDFNACRSEAYEFSAALKELPIDEAFDRWKRKPINGETLVTE